MIARYVYPTAFRKCQTLGRMPLQPSVGKVGKAGGCQGVTSADLRRNLSTSNATECHAPKAAGCWRVFIVEKTCQFAGGVEAGNGDIVRRENSRVQIALESSVSATCERMSLPQVRALLT